VQRKKATARVTNFLKGVACCNGLTTLYHKNANVCSYVLTEWGFCGQVLWGQLGSIGDNRGDNKNPYVARVFSIFLCIVPIVPKENISYRNIYIEHVFHIYVYSIYVMRGDNGNLGTKVRKTAPRLGF
jgi:hypothetical protein